MGGPFHIAIVDDDRSVRKALRRLLASAGFDVAVYPSGEAFLDSLQGRTPDCLLLDLKMPGLSGADLQRRLRRSGMTIPTLILSAHDDAEARRQCLAVGARQFLTKPFDGAELLSAIGQIVAGQIRDDPRRTTTRQVTGLY
jgi:FixJ family two-component response regulator